MIIGSHRGKILFSFCVAIAVLCAVAASIYANFAQINHQKERVEHTHAVINSLQELMSEMKDVQSAPRGYVITGMEDYLIPYYAAIPKVGEQISSLERLVGDNPEQLEALSNLKTHVERRIETAETLIKTAKSQGQKSAIEYVKKGAGKREMDEIRVIVAEMIGREQGLLAVRRTAVDDYFKITMYAGLSGLLVFIAILSAVFITMNKEAGYRIKTEENLRDAVTEMERNTAEAQILNRMGDYLRGCREQEEAYEMIASNIPLLFPNSFGSVLIFSNSRNILHPVTSWGDIPEGIAKEFEPEDCWALRQGRLHISNNSDSTPVCEHLEMASKDYIYLCLPMQAQGETIGQMYIGGPKSEAKKMGKRELGTVRKLTEQISLALANLNLQKALREQSIKDPLTKLYNRRYLEETLARECSRAHRNQQELTVLLMDIDHFKKVNDTYGHDAGDAVLVSFAKLLASKGRKEDIACRWGGEEFILVLGAAGEDLAQSRAQEICDAARALKITFQGKHIPITVSIGAAVFPAHGEGPEDLIRNADVSLYKAKQGGRDCVVMFDPALTA